MSAGAVDDGMGGGFTVAARVLLRAGIGATGVAAAAGLISMQLSCTGTYDAG